MPYVLVESLLQKAVKTGLINSEDEIYCKNQIMVILGLDGFPDDVEPEVGMTIPDILDRLEDFGVENRLITELQDDRDMLSSKIMNVFLPLPSGVNKTFYEKYLESPRAATEYFFNLSKVSNYIQIKKVAKNISYKTSTDYGEIDITINLSKPEKDPKQIALEASMKTGNSNYPKCLLCIENEGYAGRIGHPARSNHRLIHMDIVNENWRLQYSPYVYYNEHCILLSAEHKDMKIDVHTFERLIDFVEKLPHYFIGSNADLPIVGGSILSHDHYQGGNYEFALTKANEEYCFEMEDFADIKASVVKWPISVIRLKSETKHSIIKASDYILKKWIQYSDESVGIHAYSGDTRHNTISPIARMRDGYFEIDLVLRNNRTSEEHPLGIFHPHSDIHHIKKENIGLIEVMGLAVLPARLSNELSEVKKYILGEPNGIKDYHVSWADDLIIRFNGKPSYENIDNVLKEEVANKFLRALIDAGVYKRTDDGIRAFNKFTDTL